MYSNIVKVLGKQENSYGTGMVIAENKVLTVEHVVRNEGSVYISWDNQDYLAKIEYTDENIAILLVENEKFKLKYNSALNKIFFTTDEVVTEESKWTIEGYITCDLNEHFMCGVGIFSTDNKEDLFSLRRIEVGTAANYQGLSGSPVIVQNRAIGILQVQHWDSQGVLGIKFLPGAFFENKLPASSLCEPQYMVELKQKSRKICCAAVEKNKNSAKYIPEIYVEEGDYKDKLRYFSKPLLFINKVVDDLQGLDFSKVNQFLKKEGRRTIDFTRYPDEITIDDYEDVLESLKQKVRSAIAVLKEWETKKPEGNSIEERYVTEYNGNSFLKWELKDIYEQLAFFHYRFLLLTRNAGQGKTNFLCDYTENFVLKNDIPALYYNATEFCEKPSRKIIRELTLNGKYDEKYVSEMLSRVWEKSRIPFIVVIDGLNENTTLSNFGIYMEQSLSDLMDKPFLKFVMTTRKELLEERFGMLNSKNLGECFYHLDMLEHDDRFASRIFEGYLQYFDVQIMRGTLVNETYKMLSEDTLLLRFFCEVNKGKRQVYMYDIYKYAVFSEYFKNKKNEMKNKVAGGDVIFDKMMNSICQYMVENKVFNNIPRDMLKSEEVQLLNILLEADVIFKEDQIVKRGFTDQLIEVMSFTFDEFRDFCLTRYLIKRPGAEQSFLMIWNKLCDEQWIILEGVEKYLFFLARTSVPNILPILKQNKRYEEIYWKNVWNLEDKDISNTDIDKWRKHFLEGSHQNEIVKFLIVRRNREYFKNVSIDLLFSFMDILALHPGNFDLFVKKYFPITQYDKYNRRILQENCVFYCDAIVHEISRALDDQDDRVDYYDFLKLLVYLHDTLPKEIEYLWIKAYENYSDVITQIAGDFLRLQEIPRILSISICKIVAKLIDKSSDDNVHRLYARVQNDVDYVSVTSTLENIWG